MLNQKPPVWLKWDLLCWRNKPNIYDIQEIRVCEISVKRSVFPVWTESVAKASCLYCCFPCGEPHGVRRNSPAQREWRWITAMAGILKQMAPFQLYAGVSVPPTCCRRGARCRMRDVFLCFACCTPFIVLLAQLFLYLWKSSHALWKALSWLPVCCSAFLHWNNLLSFSTHEISWQLIL